VHARHTLFDHCLHEFEGVQGAPETRLEGQDYVWEDLQLLRRKLLKTGSTDAVLRQWSQGIVGDKTFQQISEEFAAIVIPKVWKREGRKISRVAARLSISPKKVRRILSQTGVIGERASR